jgi:hypothetical protein
MNYQNNKTEKYLKKSFKFIKNKLIFSFKKIKKVKINKKLLILSFISLFISSGVIFGAFQYKEVGKIIEEAQQLKESENYSKAIEKFGLAQNNWLVKNVGIKEEEINNKIKENKKLQQDKEKYEEGVEELTNDNLDSSISLLSELSKDSFYYQKAQTKIEEAKRINTEKELGETKLLKAKAENQAREAEKEAQQQAALKKQKEEELAEKEAEERKMNTDNDGDGLTYREEQNLDTSDNNIDSDNDGINDNYDLHPNGGGRGQAQDFHWSYNGQDWEYKISIHEDWYEYYKSKPRQDHGTVYVTANDKYIKQIAETLKEKAEEEGYCKSCFIASFVQGLPYIEDYYTGFDEYPKYPIETFIEKNGDCEDTAYLYASLMKAAGIGVSLVELPNHMATAIMFSPDSSLSGYYYNFKNHRYYFLETTGENFNIGDMPSDFKFTKAKLIDAWSNKVSNLYPQYEKACYTSSDLPGYYYDDDNYFYSNSNCTNLATCISYEDFYLNPRTVDFYWDNDCTQKVVKGCHKSSNFPGYFYDDYDNYYYDSRCLRDANVCRASSYHSDRYWDGEDTYWDSNCTQRVRSWCLKSAYHPGYFFSTITNNYYYDYKCNQEADL